MPTYDETARYGLPVLQGSNVISDIDAGFTALAEALDEIIATADAGASLPESSAETPGILGRFFRLTTTGQIFFDYGTGWIDLHVRVPVVTELPSSPYDGQEVIFRASSGDAWAEWHLRYYAASPSDHKWEFIGGSPLQEEIATEQARDTDASYGDLATVGPSITVPLDGEYDVEHGFVRGADGQTGYMGLSIASAAVQTGDVTGVQGISLPAAPLRRRRDLDADALLRAKYRSAQSGTSKYRNRYLSILPARVG